MSTAVARGNVAVDMPGSAPFFAGDLPVRVDPQLHRLVIGVGGVQIGVLALDFILPISV